MRTTNRLVLFVITGIGLQIAVAFALGILTSTKLLMLLFLEGAATAGYVVYRKGLVNHTFEKLEQQNQSTYAGSWGEEEARQCVIDWSKRNYRIRDEIKFRWDNAEYTYDEVVNLEGEREGLFAYWTDYGESNKKIIVYVNATQKKLIDHHIIDPGETLEHPWVKCSYWKTCQRRMRRRAYHSKDNGRQNGSKQQFSMVGAAVPVQNQGPTINNPDDEGE